MAVTYTLSSYQCRQCQTTYKATAEHKSKKCLACCALFDHEATPANLRRDQVARQLLSEAGVLDESDLLPHWSERIPKITPYLPENDFSNHQHLGHQGDFQ
jgi:hypothetical protein